MIRRPAFSPDELHIVPTADGWSVALGRYRPRGRTSAREPVILCHGLGANRFNFDLDERYSAARYLARRGFDVWILELRGRGLVSRPLRPDATALFTFDDQASHDVPTAIAFVRSMTGAARVSWVGHSKGGLLLYALLARRPDLEESLASAIFLGSPGGFTACEGLRRRIRPLVPLLARMPAMPTRALSGLAMFRLPPRWMVRDLCNLDNVEPHIGRLAAVAIIENLGVGVVRQFLSWISTGQFVSLEGHDYLAGLERVRVPALFVAGEADPFSPPAAVAVAHRRWGGHQKQMLVASVEHGFHADYGHGDLSIGRHAPEEIYPLLAGFLAAHATAPVMQFAV